MNYRLLAVWIAAIVVAAGCGLAEGPKEKLDRGIYQFNEGLRWGRYNDVLPVVDDEALDHFKKLHEGWGSNVQISSAEVLQVIYDEVNRKALVSVKFTWFRKNEMVVYDTVTNQHWEYREGKWWMVAEEIYSGQPF
ncbi:MAG: hypothetical protein JXX29_01115 [Deltaproteobacteria bacterium]|nr:hypothetical protein [Deltaproteobacteria bacterium]MBN2670238.1 hypothetical protein [Deltaproteobacteria bacterium]